MAKFLYNGFSSTKFNKTKSFKITNVEAVKTDLLNHIWTLKGERLMMPNFGTRIPEYVFDPLTEDLVELIREELAYVFDYDPRVRTISLSVVPYYDEYRVVASAVLQYIELNMTDKLILNLEFQDVG